MNERNVMNGVQKAIFPGTLTGVVVLVMLTKMIGLPLTVLAAAPPVAIAAPAGQPAQPDAAAAATAVQVEDSQTTQQPADQPPVEDPAPTGDCSISQSFPDSVRQWCGLIDKYAATQGDPNAYSHSGAVGLMQVMPSDGLAAGFMCVNGPCFASRPSMAELYDPEFNLSYGMRMLAGLVQRRGSVRDALLAYGPAEVGYYYADKVLAIYEAHR
jgi:hypothetical protein